MSECYKRQSPYETSGSRWRALAKPFITPTLRNPGRRLSPCATCSFTNTLEADPDQVWETWKGMRRWRGPWFVDFEPVCYVRAEAAENDDEPFEEKMKRLVVQLRAQQAEAAKLDAAIAANLKKPGYGG